MSSLRECLLDEKAPIAKRMRSVFLIRQLDGDEAVSVLSGALTSPSVLLGHEAAYVMGQMRNPRAIPYLTAALENSSLDSIVRHEAGEALGAICSPDSLPVLGDILSQSHVDLIGTRKIR